jgi:thymidylate kinase
MKNRTYFIHLEGMDLGGKTSVCRGLMQALGEGCELRHNSLWPGNPIHELADRLRREGRLGEAVLGHLYVAALAADLDGYTPPVGNAIQDSTILLRSLAYHAIARTPFVVDALSALLPRHPRFTRSFVLTADLGVRRQRLYQRQEQQPDEVAPDDLMVVRSPDRFLAMEQELVHLARQHFSAAVIDTSGMATCSVVETILSALP